MKRITYFSTIIAIFTMISFSGCGKLKTPTAPTQQRNDSAITLNANADDNWCTEKTFTIGESGQKKLKIDKVSTLTIRGESIIPPDPSMTSITITACGELVQDSPDAPMALVYEFGPSGTQFSPAAELELKWNKLSKLGGDEVLFLNLWDESTQSWVVKSKSDESNPAYTWDKNNKKVTFNIPHFSLWAITNSGPLDWL